MKTVKVMKVDDIKIPLNYAKPSENKLNECREYFRQHGKIDREIVVGNSNIIKDGYVGYIVLKENNIEETEVVRYTSISKNSYRENETIYVYGQHVPRLKEYCWRVTKRTRDIENLNVGNHMLVRTKHGNKYVVITKIERLDKPPVDFRVKKVLKCYGK